VRDSGGCSLREVNRTEKVDEQKLLHANYDFEHIGNGPGPGGWRMSPNGCFRCRDCEYMMSGDSSASDQCFCGHLFKDVEAGRIGCVDGDDAIGVYRVVPKVAP